MIYLHNCHKVYNHQVLMMLVWCKMSYPVKESSTRFFDSLLWSTIYAVYISIFIIVDNQIRLSNKKTKISWFCFGHLSTSISNITPALLPWAHFTQKRWWLLSLFPKKRIGWNIGYITKESQYLKGKSVKMQCKIQCEVKQINA